MSLKNVRGQGYSEADTALLSDAEAAAMARRRVQELADEATRRSLGPPDFRRGAAPDSFRSAGLENVPGDLSDPNRIAR